MPFDYIVFDEITKAQKHDNAYMKPLRKIIKAFPHRTGLTGTLLEAGYMGLFGQVRLIDGGEALDHRITYYRNKYFDKGEYCEYVYHLKEGAGPTIMQAIDHLTVTVKDADWLDKVKPEFIDIPVTLPAKARPHYKELEKELITLIERGPNKEDDTVIAESRLVLCNKLRQVATGQVYDEDRKVVNIHTAKLEALGELLKKIKEPVLIATSFKHEVASILKAFPALEEFKESRMEAWKAGKVRGWVANAGSISHGIDGIQYGSRIVIWYSPTYSFGATKQFNDRIIGGLRALVLKKTPIIYRLVMSDTIEEAVIEVVATRQSDSAAFADVMKNLESFRSVA